ncbi:MAG: YhgE/Pip family protein [Microbacteriaceae bacterium]|nr:YhgE/Pip family protein [Microbacteriaceae bacterium]MCL2796024.1 YhgE/Pip family protein [Microbacteriaceae bacterium]
MSFLTQFSERVSSRRRLSLVSIVGLVLVPFVIAGVLVWALWNPQDRLDSMQAAIVNDDKPVTLNGQIVPLGRELAAGLVGTAKPGSKAAGQNFDWVITDGADAKTGLSSGRYSAVITIPKDFSAAATSTATPAQARKATISVETSKASKVLDQTISQTVATTAASMLGSQLTASYLDNVYLGFNTLGDKLGEAASGAQKLADSGPALVSGAQQEASGLQQLAAGQQQAATGAQQLATGQQKLATGLSSLASGASGVSTGVAGVASGVQQLSDGTTGLVTGTQGVASGLDTLNTQAQQLEQAAQSGLLSGPALTAAIGQLQGGIAQAASGAHQVAAGTSSFSSHLAQAASGAAQVKGGAAALASGAAQSAGAAQQLASGAAQSASGAQQLATASSQAASGASTLATGLAQYTGGTSQLASGLGTAVKSLPSYSDAERKTLSKVVATPVGVTAAAGPGFGALAAPIFGVLALWLGALACFVVLRPVSVTALGSSRSSVVIALRGLVIPAVVGAVQGIAVAGALEPMLRLGPAGFLGLAGVGVLAAIAFAAVNQALVALLGGAGRFVSMLVILLGLATGLVGTAPAFLTALAGFTPIGPAQSLVAAVVQGTAVPGGSVFGLVLWLFGAVAVTTLAVARGRTLPASRLAPAAASGPAGSSVPAQLEFA